MKISASSGMPTSIYGWRGANIENILNFERDYPVPTVMLEQNYRSTQNILMPLTRSLRITTGGRIRTSGPKRAGDKISYYQAQNEHDEAQYIVSKIQEIQRA